nr:hypothetical protein [Tanacetum cinerariifolium]
GEGSTVPAESHHTPTGAPSTLQPYLSSLPRSSIRQETEVPQPSSPTHTYVADEATSTCVDVKHEGATTILTSLDAGQGSGNINKTPSMPHDSPLPRVNTLGSDEGSMTLQELTVLCITLSQKVESLEEDLKQTKQVYGAGYTKLIIKVKELEKTVKTSKARREAKIVVFDDEEEFEIPFKKERTKVLVDTARRNVQTYTRRKAVSTCNRGVSTASRMISTAEESVSITGASMPDSTAGMIGKGKGIMEESESDGEGSTVPAESHHTPTGAPSTLQPYLSSLPRSSIRQETEVPQPSSPTHTYVADEATSTCVDVKHEGATTILTSLDAGQGSGNINKTPSMPHDSPLPRVNTLGSDEGSMTLQELTVLCITLSQKVESLEEDLKQTKQVYGAGYTKLIIKVKELEKTVKTSKARREAKIVVFDDEEEFEIPFKKERNQLGVLSAAKVLVDTARRNVQTYTRRRAVSTCNRGVSTASRMISTAEESVSTTGASMPDSTAGMIGKGKGIMEESESDVTKTKRQQEQERLGLETAELFKATMRSIKDFVPMESEDDKVVPKLAEARSSKKDVDEELDQGRDDLVQLWSLVKERFSLIKPTDDKERVLWVALKRLFVPDDNDELWES